MQYDPPSSDGTSEVSANVGRLRGGNATLTGLTPFTKYAIKVAANSEIRHGPFSDTISEVTAEDGKLTTKHRS